MNRELQQHIVALKRYARQSLIEKVGGDRLEVLKKQLSG